jgi:hypothetical protein
MQDFFEPMNETINWLQANAPFADYNTMGLSGGGWTSHVYPALDQRIHITIGDAGGGPGYQFPPNAYVSPNYGDCIGASGCYGEQQGTPAPNRFYDIAGYMDLYLMGAYGLATVSGAPRYHRQIVNTYDSAAYGNTQWTDSSFNYQTYYTSTAPAQCGNANPCTWQTYLTYYSQQIANLLSTLGGPGSFPPVVADKVANWHQISDCGDSSSFTVSGSGGTQSGTCIPANATAVGGYPDAISLMLAALDANPPSVIVLAGGTRGLRVGGR